MTRDEAIALHIPERYIEDFLPHTVEYATTQFCRQCNRVMVVHRDAIWRFVTTPIRCGDCIAELVMKGMNRYEAHYVE